MNKTLKAWVETVGRKPRVLILADVPGWAYDINSRGLREALSDEFDIDIAYLHHGPQPNLRPDYYDLYHVCCWVDLVGRYGIEKERFVKEVSSHRWEEPRYGSLSPKQFCEKYLSDSATITATSKRLQALIRQGRPCLLVPNGVSAAFSPPEELRTGDLIFGWAGNIDDSCKGLKDILLPATYHLLDLRIAPGNVGHDAMADFYRGLDVICVASDREGEPLPLLEGMACGCFPLCTDVGIVPELVRNGENGLIVERTPEAFRRAFLWCRENAVKVREAGRKNAELIRRTRGWDKLKGAWSRAWSQALSLQAPATARQRGTTFTSWSLPERCAAAFDWIKENRVGTAGIAVSNKNRRPYPEVTGYTIPTLLEWGERELAVELGEWLLSIQAANGAFLGPDDKAAYVFDTGQVLRGLLALTTRDLLDGTQAMKHACEWICGQIAEDGTQTFPDILQWRSGSTPEGVILYALEPARRAAVFLGRKDLVRKIDACVRRFVANPHLTDFTCLSHFHAYICEALFDLGYPGLSRAGLEKAWERRLPDGGIPAYADVPWTCSTGMFQYAGLLAKMGDAGRADACFSYMAARQNSSGGWFGSYGPGKDYFPEAEISWAVKYFLDALRLRQVLSFEGMADRFLAVVDERDGRWQLLEQEIEHCLARHPGKLRVLDAGCGKGRYLDRLAQSRFAPRLELYGCDLSPRVLAHVRKDIPVRAGGILDLPYPDASFDFVFTSEVLEHSVLPANALRELLRVLVNSGELLVIDKNVKRLGQLSLHETEQWFDAQQVANILQSLGAETHTVEAVPYENGNDDLFTAWIAIKGGGYPANLSAASWHEAIVAAQNVEKLAFRVRNGDSPAWLQQILESTAPGDMCLELGSGTGALSAALAMQGRRVLLLDFSQESLDFSERLFERLGLQARFIHADILTKFPLEDDSCDCVWSSGVLEHFSAAELAHIMRESVRVARQQVISLVPNAASLPYRLGKWLQEQRQMWKYGYEDPKFSLREVFSQAGLTDISEFSVEPFHALNFLQAIPELGPAVHALRDFYASLAPGSLSGFNQGYLLVTIGHAQKSSNAHGRGGAGEG